MTTRIDVWSDFVCPFCYMASLSLRQLELSHNVAVYWRSYELRPHGSPPMPPDYRARIEASQPQLEQSFREQFGVEIRRGSFDVDSRPALIGEKFAEARGLGAAYHAAVNDAYWLHGAAIADPAVLREIAVSVGIDGAAFSAALDDPAYDAQVAADVQQAHEFGLRGVPALVFDAKFLVAGARPYPYLVEVVEQLSRQ